MSRLGQVIIVGASAAGVCAAESLRRRGYTGRLTLVGDEPHPPYDRPPLSKQLLSGAWDVKRVALLSQSSMEELRAELLLGRTAKGVDLADRMVVLEGGDRLPFNGLVIATGVTPRRLPTGHELAGVHVLHGLDEAMALRAQLLEQPRVVVVGAGFLGTEVAAAARNMGLEVAIVDPDAVPMGRQLGQRLGSLVAQLHVDHGVRLRLGVGITQLVGSAGRVVRVDLADGTTLPADVVLVSIGSVPRTDWLAGSGISLRDGVECDAYCQAAAGIYAAGDVARWHHPGLGRAIRLEHRMNATEQGMAVAGNLLGDRKPFTPLPYFWSDQYDTRIQACGILPLDAEVAVVHGDLNDRKFVALYRRQGKVVGVVGWNSPRELHHYRRQICFVPDAA